jgi:16S rRNA (cytidine1402-2'-O)-methyltransferase
MLYLIATPIGNLSDITLRALETLKACDYILCEDTRHSLNLLRHFEIKKSLKSYHKFNEVSQLDLVLEDLRQGKNICLISDAGTPCISDPGSLIVKKCIEHKLPFTAIPGPCAAIQALSCSGLPTERFQFWGFLARKKGELKQELQKIYDYPGSTICYESPHRLLDVLALMHQMQPGRYLVVGRELTKKYEEIVRGTALDLIEYWKEFTLKGEIVLIISPGTEKTQPNWDSWSPEDHVKWIQKSYDVTKKEAIKLAAELRGVPKRQIYQHLLETDSFLE